MYEVKPHFPAYSLTWHHQLINLEIANFPSERRAKHMRVRFSGLGVAILLSGLFPFLICGQAQPTPKVTLNFVGRNWAQAAFDPWLAAYEKKTGVKVIHEPYPLQQYSETIEIKYAAKATDVDVLFVDPNNTPSYVIRGMLKPVDSYFTQADINKWTSAAQKMAMYNGHLYNPPFLDSTGLLYFNKDLLKKAGVAFPSQDVNQRWTWEQVVDAAKKVRALGPDIWGLMWGQPTTYYQLQPLPMSLSGSNGLSPDGKTADITSAPWLKAFQWYSDVFNLWNIAPKGVSISEVDQLFSSGKIGFVVTTELGMRTYAKAGVDFGVAPHPYFQGGKVITPTGSWGTGVWSFTQHEAEGANLLKAMTVQGDLSMTLHQMVGYWMPHVDVVKYIEANLDYNKQPFYGYRIAGYESAHTATARASTPAYVNFELILGQTFSDIRNGADVKSSLQGAADRINNELSRYY
jgi:ABC-type glycerol-3-phosphate transport system substrate-binding protein